MASYKIEWRQSARRELRSLNKSLIQKILQLVEKLAENPFPAGCRKLVGWQNTYRVRVGVYRVLYSVQARRLFVEIVRVSHRREAYKPLI